MFNFWRACNGFSPWKDDKQKLRQKFVDKWGGKSYEESRQEIESHLDILYSSGFIGDF